MDESFRVSGVGRLQDGLARLEHLWGSAVVLALASLVLLYLKD